MHSEYRIIAGKSIAGIFLTKILIFTETTSRKKNFKMYRYLSIVVLIFTVNVYSQCELSLEQLDKSTSYTLSEFETFAKTNGYSFNSDSDSFVCDTAYQNTAYLQLIRTVTDESHHIIEFVFFSRSTFSDFKSFLQSNGKLDDFDVNNGSTLRYIYDGRAVMLQSKTLNSMPVYFLSISNEKLN